MSIRIAISFDGAFDSEFLCFLECGGLAECVRRLEGGGDGENLDLS